MPNEGRAHPLAWAPSQDEGPDLPITFQETCSTSKRGLSSKPERLVQQASEACSAGLGDFLSKFVRLALQGKEGRPHYYKKAPTPSKKVCITNPSLAF